MTRRKRRGDPEVKTVSAAQSMQAEKKWTNPSVLKLAPIGDPVSRMVSLSRDLVLRAKDVGWPGPPFDPFALAQILGVTVVPCEEVLDARLLPGRAGRFVIEFNPNRPKSRIRYSIAHELGHMLFPDCQEQVRHRMHKGDVRGDEWQLEMLCNIAASEILMPVGSFTDLGKQPLTIDVLMGWREKYEVSSEALLLRTVRLTHEACMAFCCSARKGTGAHDKYVLDYAVPSRTASVGIRPGTMLPKGSHVEECTAIGFTAKGDETWPLGVGRVHVECVGIPPYPTQSRPRVAGVATFSSDQMLSRNDVTYLTGDATEPRGSGRKIVAFVVNDKALSWGAGFGLAVQRKWPVVRSEFEAWAKTNRAEFRLGSVRSSLVSSELTALAMICQHGYGPSPTPRIRYTALETCLKKLTELALSSQASVHVPRIGCGEAGGSWDIVAELLETNLCQKGIKVTVYSLPGSPKPKPRQHGLFDLGV